MQQVFIMSTRDWQRLQSSVRSAINLSKTRSIAILSQLLRHSVAKSDFNSFRFSIYQCLFRNDACTLCTMLWLPRLQRSSSLRAWRAHIEVLRLCATEGEVLFVPFNTPARSKILINSDPLPGAPKSVVTNTSSSGPRLTLSPIRPSRLDTYWTRFQIAHNTVF